MKRHTLLRYATLFVIIIVATGACKKKGDKETAAEEKTAKQPVEISCKTLAEKNKKCANELADAIMDEIKDKIPEEMVEKMHAKVRESAASDDFVVQCEKHWDSEDEMDKMMRKQFTNCFSIENCKEYAECIKKTF